MKKILLVTLASFAMFGSASAAELMTDSQLDGTTAGGRRAPSQSLAIALGGSAAYAHGGSTNVAGAVHVNYASTTPNSAFAISAGAAVAYSSGRGGCGCNPR